VSEVSDNVGEVTAPESFDTLFRGDTGKAIDDASVTRDLSTDNLGVSILSLDEELDTLNGSSTGLGDGTRHTSGKEVDEEIFLLTRHD